MKASDIVFFIGFGVVATFITTSMWRDRLRKRRTTTSLTARPQHNDEQFARGFFPDPKRADIAVRARRVLSNNLKMPLDGLAPGDRFEADLNAELPVNLCLFWDLETEFGIKTGVEDADLHLKNLERLVTFQDLVDYVEGKMSEPRKDHEKSR